MDLLFDLDGTLTDPERGIAPTSERIAELVSGARCSDGAKQWPRPDRIGQKRPCVDALPERAVGL